MFCENCGAQIEDGARFCPNCGAPVKNEAAENGFADQAAAVPVSTVSDGYAAPENDPVSGNDTASNGYTAPADGSYGAIAQVVTFGGAISRFFTNYAQFRGRASRTEYWFATLFVGLITSIGVIPIIGWILAFLISLGVMVPSLAITVRRLQDAGYRWNYIFMGFIPFAGAVLLIVACCRPSVPDNEYGPSPF